MDCAGVSMLCQEPKSGKCRKHSGKCEGCRSLDWRCWAEGEVLHIINLGNIGHDKSHHFPSNGCTALQTEVIRPHLKANPAGACFCPKVGCWRGGFTIVSGEVFYNKNTITARPRHFYIAMCRDYSFQHGCARSNTDAGSHIQLLIRPRLIVVERDRDLVGSALLAFLPRFALTYRGCLRGGSPSLGNFENGSRVQKRNIPVKKPDHPRLNPQLVTERVAFSVVITLDLADWGLNPWVRFNSRIDFKCRLQRFWQHGTRRCNSGCLVTILQPPPAPRFLHSTYFWTSARTFPQAASTMVGHIDDHHSEESPLGGHWTCCFIVRVVRSPLPPFLRSENGPAIVTKWTNPQASIVPSQGTLEGEGSDPPRQTNLSDSLLYWIKGNSNTDLEAQEKHANRTFRLLLAYSAWMGLDLLSSIDGPVPRLRPIVAELCKSTSLSGYHYRGRNPLRHRSLYIADRQPSIIDSGHWSLQNPKPQCG
ncbi:uncharacterized protein BO88DRAFT_445539 [Aspergillus vadensis CBS 113365]|uniref:Uncharacterized protein n=1 Tax=Aspergillus vadensis (strain CBS 113365 / IMI 142717 / IBT 24658) TaxID=1448311 RepID=A0A319CD55_ASPVC|nr:hypothetical protein BO88DRAFT_445539 [Aspergillus vadensis CBS 113365]PYH66312.1 hypothetical protein BO88DRAFT_445539 [Aspergillus vadensis CBS 113365]